MTGDGLRVVVAGAGFGGLSAAAWASRAGHRVTIVEGSPTVGGKAGRVAAGGFRFDTGPTLLTLPDVMRETFRAAGGDLDRDVGLVRLRPVCRYVFEGGETFDVTDDIDATAAAIDAIFPGEGAGYREFMERAAYYWRYAGEPYLEAPYESSLQFMKRVLARGWNAFGLSSSLATLRSLAAEHFSSPELRSFAGRFATYCGGDPARSGASYAMIPHLEHQIGAFHPRGGMHGMALALASRLQARGVTVRCNAPVRELVRSDGRVRGVRVGPSDELIECDAVIANVDPEIVLGRWLTLDARQARSAGLDDLHTRERSLSGCAFLLGIDGAVPMLAHHNVLFPRDYDAEFRAVFEQRTVCAEPTVYVCNTTASEPGVAPPGCSSLFVLVNAPAVGDETPATLDIDAIESRVIARLSRLIPDVATRIRVRARVTPRDIARLGSPGGAIYGEAPHGAMAPFRRTPQRCDAVPGLYFAGGSVHPGGGVPMVTLGGRHAAALLERDAARLGGVRPKGDAKWNPLQD